MLRDGSRGQHHRAAVLGVEFGAVEQRDEADEGRVEAKRGMVKVRGHGVVATKDRGAVVRPSQLIASVGQASGWIKGAFKQGDA